MDLIKSENIRTIENMFVNPDYQSGFSLERGKYCGVTDKRKRDAGVENLMKLMDKCF